MISIKQLKYALSVRTHLHFKNAAEDCNVSQSALSSAISELEKQLDTVIFERDNKKVLVTPEGEQLLEQANKIMLATRDMELMAAAQKQPLALPMSIGVIPTIGPYLLPKVLPEVRKQHPDLNLSIGEHQSHELVRLVKSGELDAGILALPYDLEGLLAFEFWQEDFYLLCHKEQYPTAKKEIKSADIDSGDLLLLQDGHCLKDHALAACHLPSSKTDQTMAGTSLYTLVQMVASKMGATLVPEMAIDQLIGNSKELKTIHLSEPGPHRTIALIIRPNYPALKNIEELKKLFIRALN